MKMVKKKAMKMIGSELCIYVVVLAIFSNFWSSQAAQIDQSSPDIISPTLASSIQNPDVATVFGHHRFIRPSSGVVTSTTRTFIHDGATTEFASQVLATTLPDGRYAHLLARSSRVFYEGQTKLPPNADPRLNDVTWPDVRTIIGNTDYIVTPEVNTITAEVVVNTVVASTVKQQQQPVVNKKIVVPEIKRVTAADLSTFTIGVDSGQSSLEDMHVAESDIDRGREARKLEDIVLNEEIELARTTYYGFADFTTTVGNTIIVFSPSTSAKAAGHATKIVGDATLHEGPAVKPTLTKSYQEITRAPVQMTPKIAPTHVMREMEIKPTATVVNLVDAVEEIVEEIVEEVEKEVTEEATEPLTEITTEFQPDMKDNEVSPVDIPKLSIPTNEDIAKIFEALNRETATVNQETVVKGGVTTIFFEDETTATPVLETSVPEVTATPITPAPVDCPDPEYLTYLTTFFLEESTSVETNVVAQCTKAVVAPQVEKPVVKPVEKPLAKPAVRPVVDEVTEKQKEVVRVESSTNTVDASSSTTEEVQQTTEELEETSEASTVEPATISGRFQADDDDNKTEEVHQARSSDKQINAEEETKDMEQVSTQVDQVTDPIQPSVAAKSPSEERVVYETTQQPESTEPDFDFTTESVADIEIIYKTLYTTYTYLTTFFRESTSSVSVRKDVVTNIITTTITPSLMGNIDDIVSSMVDKKVEQVVRPTVAYTATPSLEDLANAIQGSDSGVKTLYTTYTYFTTLFDNGETDIASRTEVYTNYATQSPQLEATPVQDASYSTMLRSKNVTMLVTDVRSSSSSGRREIPNNQLDDQVSSESNTDEIIPSATLLLQTSYTTFTYFTTMYMGSTSTVVSRLETITNVVTDTIDNVVLDSTLPITYFTTFTYWTTLYRDGTTTITSREETVSNVINNSDSATDTTMEIKATTIPDVDASLVLTTTMDPSATTDPLTYFTTYTYYTTSYVGDETVINSRFETVTNVVASPTARAIDINTLNTNAIVDVKKPGVVTRLLGKEPEEDSTTTEILPSSTEVVDEEVVKATTAAVEEAKPTDTKSTLPTGLVRLINGTTVNNHTTTVYQSRIVGTVIDGRYAQIIESTSSYIIDKTTAPTPALASTSSSIDPTPEVTTEPLDEADIEPSHGVGTFPRRKSFTPVIRPFSSRARPTFNPKRKGATISALTVTRTDLTPTIKATPAVKLESTRGRFASRKSSLTSSVISTPSRRFSKTRASILPSSTRRIAAPQSTSLADESTPTTTAPSSRTPLDIRTRRPLAFNTRSRATTTFQPPTTTTAKPKSFLRPSFGNRTRPGSRFPPRFLLRPKEAAQDLEEDENTEPSTRRKRQVPEYGSRARYVGRRTTTTTTTTAAPYSYYRRRTQATSRTRPAYRTQPQRQTHQTNQRATSRRPPTRMRGRTEAPEYVLPPFDGTITVTHLVPITTSVPKVADGQTLFRHLVTASTSVEVLPPDRYTVSTGFDGGATTVLSQLTSLAPNGATEVIHLRLKESPTSTIIFTPTTIRGRKTSFSHVVPTTAYTVERIVSTVSVENSAPLANILLSQLLLGNLGQLGQFGNLGQINTAVLPAPAPTQPVTHYHTRTTSFVTTITNEQSTVLPLTYHGKQILTTIYDRTLNTVTATEYITDTVVEQPHMVAATMAVPQLNSLLLPLLLQQQAPIIDDSKHLQTIEEDTKQAEPSVVTLYVSGRKPGDFSTLLSTVERARRTIAPTEIVLPLETAEFLP
ncbi:hypothetical protein DMENIID0001_163220 [Sergentomyia squamirostris]